MPMFYCQEDGGQWNVPVTVERCDNEVAVIYGPSLIGTYTDKQGNGWLIVSKDMVHDKEHH